MSRQIIPFLNQKFTVLASSYAPRRTFSTTASHISLPPCSFFDLEMESEDRYNPFLKPERLYEPYIVFGVSA